MRPNTHTQRVLDLLRQRGMLRPCDLDDIGAPRIVLTRMVASGLLEKAGRGLYRLTDSHPSEAREPGCHSNQSSTGSHLPAYGATVP